MESTSGALLRALILITLLYVIPVVIMWRLERTYCVVKKVKPDSATIFRTLFPLLNIILIIPSMNDVNELFPNKRSTYETFFAIKPDDYWRKDSTENE